MHNHHPHPKFSIITVTYNAAKVLEDTIQSIVTQTYKNLEYIIVDGGSTDETLDIIHKYQEHITTVISEPDQGLYDAMNKGIKLATGDYLCFLNAGDGLHEDDTLLQWYIPSMEQLCREYYMEKQKLWTVKGIFIYAPPVRTRNAYLEKLQARNASLPSSLFRPP